MSVRAKKKRMNFLMVKDDVGLPRLVSARLSLHGDTYYQTIFDRPNMEFQFRTTRRRNKRTHNGDHMRGD